MNFDRQTARCKSISNHTRPWFSVGDTVYFKPEWAATYGDEGRTVLSMYSKPCNICARPETTFVVKLLDFPYECVVAAFENHHRQEFTPWSPEPEGAT